MFTYNGDIMARLKEAGWSEYKIRRANKLSAATIKSIKTGFASISMRSLEQICEMLGGVQPNEAIVYSPREPSKRPMSFGDFTAAHITDAEAAYAALADPPENHFQFVQDWLRQKYSECI